MKDRTYSLQSCKMLKKIGWTLLGGVTFDEYLKAGGVRPFLTLKSMDDFQNTHLGWVWKGVGNQSTEHNIDAKQPPSIKTS